VTGGSAYTVANAAISAIAFSKSVSPVGFPQHFTYTPTGVSATNVTLSGRFWLVGTRCHVDMSLVFTGAITFTTNPTLPIGASAAYINPADVSYAISGQGSYLDSGTGYALGTLFPAIVPSAQTVGIRNADGSSLSASSPITWANSDAIYLHFDYEI